MSVRAPALAVLTFGLAAGCSALQRNHPPLELPPHTRLTDTATTPEGRQVLRAHAASAHNVLVLSGGGVYGAFTAGVLKGWTAAGTRPRFDVVTGVSTGALIAPFALLGPEYDAQLERAYTTAENDDVFRRRPLSALPFADSLADSAPLKRRIENEITADVLVKLAEAYREGRRLYVGTTNIDLKRLVVWDVTAIAAGDDPGRLELVRKVLLASAAVPGFFPPVPIDVEVNGRQFTELHVDGGVTASLFLQPGMLGPPTTAERAVWVVFAGKLMPDPEPVPRRLLDVTGQSISGVIQSQAEGDVLRVYLLSQFAQARFGLAAVPQSFRAEAGSLTFAPKATRQLYEAGVGFGSSGAEWSNTPPRLFPTLQQRPRAGVRFELVPEQPDGVVVRGAGVRAGQ